MKKDKVIILKDKKKEKEEKEKEKSRKAAIARLLKEAEKLKW